MSTSLSPFPEGSVHEEELDDVELLRHVNRGDPTGKERLEALLPELTPDEIALRCDELGFLRYQGDQDPNSLYERFWFLRPEDFHRLDVDAMDLGDFFEETYYKPSVAAIRMVRAVVALDVNTVLEEKPPLVTHEDYLRYFETFHLDVLRELIRNLHEIEGSQGCDGPCRAICGAGAKRRVTGGDMPFETMQWLSQHFGEELCEANPVLYSASDLADYGYNSKNGADVIELFEKTTDRYPYVSTAYRLDKKAIDFLFDLVVRRGRRVDRISRLVTGKKGEDLEVLLDKLRQRAAEEGNVLDDEAIGSISRAFLQGDKGGMNTMMGNAVRPSTPESTMTKEHVACSHGVVLRAGKGFFGLVVRPASKIFPDGRAMFPIRPDASGQVRFPQLLHTDLTLVPFSGVRKVVLGPKWTIMDNESGGISEKETRSSQEQALIDVSLYKQRYLTLESFFLTVDSQTGRAVRLSEVLRRGLSGRENIPPEDRRETLTRVRNGIAFIKRCLHYSREGAQELYERYADNKNVTLEVAQYYAATLNEVFDELESLYSLLGALSGADGVDEVASLQEELLQVLGSLQEEKTTL